MYDVDRQRIPSGIVRLLHFGDNPTEHVECLAARGGNLILMVVDGILSSLTFMLFQMLCTSIG